MTSVARLAAFAAGLAAVFAASFGVGAAIGPEPQDDRGPSQESPDDHDDMDHVDGGSSGGWAP